MTSRTSKNLRETHQLSVFAGLFAICFGSGYYAYFTGHSVPGQFNLLAHVIAGFALSLSLVLYLVIHFKRAIGVRKPLVNVSGWITAALGVAYLATGWVLAIQGHTKTSTNISYWHSYGGLLLLAILAGHVLLHRLLKYKTRNRAVTATTYSRATAYRSIFFMAGYTGLVATASTVYWLMDKPLPLNPLTENYEYSYGDHPFRPSQTETSTGGFIHEKQVAGSEQCANCHQDIAQQWYSSIHRQAASDPTYVRNITLLETNKGIAATRYCEGCHAPVALLTGELTPGGQHAGIPGTTANHEGVGCLGCHGISDTVHLEGVASFLYTPPKEYLFAYSDNRALLSIGHYLTKISAQQHKQDMASPVLAEPRHCATCHAQFMDESMNGWGWVKMQDEYSAWLNSPYSQQHQQTFASHEVTRCQDCHMPLVKGKDPSANADGMIRSHRFLGANTMAPFLIGDAEQLELTQKFMQSNKMRITIETPNRTDAVQSKLNIDEQLRWHTETPYYHYLGETVDLMVVVSNIGVGHDFPGGTADINEPWIELRVTDSTGATVFHSGYLQQDGSLEPNAHAYISKPVDRHGQLVWKHDLFNRTGEAFKRTVKAGQSDVANYAFKIPSWTKGPLVATATLRYRKLNNRYARWALQDEYRDLPITDMARDTLTIDVLKEKAVSQ